MGRALLFCNGTVLTCRPGQPGRDGGRHRRRPVSWRSTTTRCSTAARGAAEFDLAGGCLVPGFRDGHAHPLWGGLELGQVPLVGADVGRRPRRARARPMPEPIPTSTGSRAAATTLGCCPTAWATRPCSTGRWLTVPLPSRRATTTPCGSTPRRLGRAGIDAATPDPRSGGSCVTATARPWGRSWSGRRSRWSAGARPCPGRPSRMRAFVGRWPRSRGAASRGCRRRRAVPREARVYAALARRGGLTTRTNIAFRAEPGRWTRDRPALRRVTGRARWRSRD